MGLSMTSEHSGGNESLTVAELEILGALIRRMGTAARTDSGRDGEHNLYYDATAGAIRDQVYSLKAGEWQEPSGMKKTSGGGYFALPAQPSVGTTVTSSASADTYGTNVEFDASTAAAIFVVGFTIHIGGSTTGYVAVDLRTGASTGTSVGEWPINIDNANDHIPIEYPYSIPIAAGTRLSVATADADAAGRGHIITLICILQSDLAAL